MPHHRDDSSRLPPVRFCATTPYEPTLFAAERQATPRKFLSSPSDIPHPITTDQSDRPGSPCSLRPSATSHAQSGLAHMTSPAATIRALSSRQSIPIPVHCDCRCRPTPIPSEATGDSRPPAVRLLPERQAHRRLCTPCRSDYPGQLPPKPARRSLPLLFDPERRSRPRQVVPARLALSTWIRATSPPKENRIKPRRRA